jgi:hypothetical protein
MTMWVMRLLALGFWATAAACLYQGALETSRVIALVAFATAFLLAGAGVGLWKGSAVESDAELMRRAAVRADGEQR